MNNQSRSKNYAQRYVEWVRFLMGMIVACAVAAFALALTGAVLFAGLILASALALGLIAAGAKRKSPPEIPTPGERPTHSVLRAVEPDPPELKPQHPAIFLAGPIQGAPLWQEEAIKIIRALDPSIWVFSPRRLERFSGKLGAEAYAAQTDWERAHLLRAGENGCVMFWLAREVEEIPGRAYAQTTRFELGEWKERCATGEAKLAVGAEEGFPGARYARRRFAYDCPQTPFCDTLIETCEAAVNLARQ